MARFVITCPTPSRPSITEMAPASTITAGSVTGFIVPARTRSMYQGARITPWDEWPHRSARTSVSATSAASSAGRPAAA